MTPLLRRLSLLALLFTAELLLITLRLDNAALAGQSGLLGLIGSQGALILRAAVLFPLLLATFALLRHRHQLATTTPPPLHRPFLAGHFAALALFAALATSLYFGSPSSPAALVWLLSGGAAILLGALAFLPLTIWKSLFLITRRLWLLCLALTLAVCFGAAPSRQLWPLAAHATFFLVSTLLRLTGNSVVSLPASLILGTSRFSVEIAPQCSGLEGMGLMLAFGITWLILFRRECRFPHALLLLPIGLVAMFLLNAVRIFALILIGDAGAEQLALGGFHSQAGWIIFILVAAAFSAVALHVPWLRKHPRATTPAENPVAPWLLPLVSILAAGMLSRAATAGFEWLYPLRFFAALCTLFLFRRSYRCLDWRLSPAAPLAGILVFLVWFAFDHLHPTPDVPIPPDRWLWLSLRTLGAVLTVPLAEELAFRGFLLRRLLSEDFEAVPFHSLWPAPATPRLWLALLLSSLCFGLLHGAHWLEGSLAGLIYALATGWRGRLADAIVAHAITNALLAVLVLFFGQWHLW